MHNLDSNGVGRSRGFGFLEFLKHGDAMKSLLAVNNNPTIFSSDKVNMMLKIYGAVALECIFSRDQS